MLSTLSFVISIILIVTSIICTFEPKKIIEQIKYIFINYFPLIIFSLGAVLFLLGLILSLLSM